MRTKQIKCMNRLNQAMDLRGVARATDIAKETEMDTADKVIMIVCVGLTLWAVKTVTVIFGW